MKRRGVALVALAAAFAGCPIPQPLPDYPAGTVTPPRIVVDRIAWPGTTVLVPAGCATAPTYDLNAQLIDVNTLELVVARWFVNYDPTNSSRYPPVQEQDILGSNANPPVTERTVPTYTFHPYDFPAIPYTGITSGNTAGAVEIVELVVSNGFDPTAVTNPPAKLPYRTPLPGFETQLYRWMFFTVTPPAGCTAGTPGCCP